MRGEATGFEYDLTLVLVLISMYYSNHDMTIALRVGDIPITLSLQYLPRLAHAPEN